MVANWASPTVVSRAETKAGQKAARWDSLLVVQRVVSMVGQMADHLEWLWAV